MVLAVIPAKKVLTEGTCVLDRAETIGKLRSVLKGFELTFRVGIVIRDMRPTVRLGDSQICQQKSHRLGGHRGSAIGVEVELAGHDELLVAGVADQALGELGAFAIGYHPADDIAAEDVQDHVEIEIGPLHRPQQLGDVPTPDLVGSRGQQLRLLIGGMTELVATFPHFAVFGQDPVHRAERTQKNAFIQQGGKDLRRSLVPKTFGMQLIQHRLPLGRRQSASRGGPLGRQGDRLPAAIPGCPGHPQSTTGSRLTNTDRQLLDGAHSFSSSIGVSGIGLPSRAASFFWTSMMSSAFPRRLLRRALAANSFRFSSTSGLRVVLRPRFFGVKAASSPCRAWRRQVDRWEEYNPSRRNSAPIAPVSWQASERSTMERL